MKRMMAMILLLASLAMLCACGQKAPAPEPEILQMRAICELATMDCYYHNVAKYFEEDAQASFFFTKDKKFWVEYAGEVTLGVDASQVTMEIQENVVTITMPPAKVLSARVYSDSLNSSSYIVAKDSAPVTVEDQGIVFQQAQEEILRSASQNQTLLARARQRAKQLLEDYVTNLGNAIGKDYQVRWVDLDEQGNRMEEPQQTAPPETGD